MSRNRSSGADAGSRNSADQQGRSDKKRSKRKGKNRQKSNPPVDPSKFWGDPKTLPASIEHVNSSPDVTAVVSSLGRMPIPPHETAAEHSFQLIYKRAEGLASALAAASGLTPTDDD